MSDDSKIKNTNVRLPGEVGMVLLFLVFGIATFVASFQLSSGQWMSPDIMPKATALLIIIFSLANLIRTIKKERYDSKLGSVTSFLMNGNVAFLLAALGVYCIVLENIGFLIASFFFLFLCISFMRRWKNLLHTAILSIILLGTLIGIFRYIFKVILP